MKLNSDYHTHTTYSHGSGSVLDNARAGKEMGLETVAITDHGFSHPAFGMRRKKLGAMRADCEKAQMETGLNVLLGIESNLLGESGKIDVRPSDYEKLDIILAGVHRFVYYSTVKDFNKLFLSNFLCCSFKTKPAEWLVKYNTKVYVECIKKNPIDVITHTNFLVFADAATVAKACADHGTYFEINTKKRHLSEKEWHAVFDTGVRFVINSDAHTPSRVGDATLFDNMAMTIGFPLDRIDNIGDKHPNFRFSELKKHL